MNMLKTSSRNQQVMRFSRIMFSIVVLLMLATLCHAQQRSIRLVEKNAPDMPEMVYRTGWALLIGINDYPNLPGNCQLNYATADALELGKLLQEMYGFPEENIITLTDEKATKQGIMDALASLADPNRINEADCVLVFFSGHGQTVPLPTSGEMGFLVPHDAKVDLGDQLDPSQYYRDCIGMDELRRLAKFIPARHVIFLVDACYSGLAVRSLKGLSPETKGYLKKIARLPVREIITAGRRGEESIESPEWGHGAFTYKLLEALSTEAADVDSDGVITGFELGAYIKQVVPRIVDQTPQFGYLDGEGEFVFIPQRVVDTATLMVEVSPGGFVSVDNGAESPAPLYLSEIDPGRHVIKVRAPDFRTHIVEVLLSPGEEKRVPVTLSRAEVILSINSKPEGARVMLDGKLQGKTPLQLDDVSTGEHKISLDLKDYEPVEHTIAVHVPAEPVFLTLVRLRGSIQIDSIPDSSVQLFPRSRTRMAMYSLAMPGSGQFYGGRHISGSAFLVAGLGAITGAIVGYTQYSQRVDDYDNSANIYSDAVTRYNSALNADEVEAAKSAMVDAHGVMTDANDDADSMFTLSRVAFGVAGGVWAVSAIHAYMTGPATETPLLQAEMSGWDIVPQLKPEIAGVMVWRRF